MLTIEEVQTRVRSNHERELERSAIIVVNCCKAVSCMSMKAKVGEYEDEEIVQAEPKRQIQKLQQVQTNSNNILGHVSSIFLWYAFHSSADDIK